MHEYTSYSQQQSGFFATIGWSRRKGLVIIGGALFLIAAAVAGIVITSDRPATQKVVSIAPAEVVIASHVTRPVTLRIEQGQSVVWENQDARSRTLKLSTAADSSNEIEASIAPGETYRYVFETRATYNFYDGNSPHRMSGVVIVE